MFDHNIIPEIGHRLRFGISAAIKKIRHDFGLGDDLDTELEKLDKLVWKPNVSQQEVINLILKAREIYSEAEKQRQ